MPDCAGWGSHFGPLSPSRKEFPDVGNARLPQFFAGPHGQVRFHVSEENMVLRVEAVKLAKTHQLIRDERGFLFQFSQRGFMGRFVPTDSSAR
jgi:hypothetical protein